MNQLFLKLNLASFAIVALLFAACGGENPAPGDDDPITPTPTGGSSNTGGGGSGATGGSGGSGTDGGTGGSIFEQPERPDCPDDPDGEQPDSHPASHRKTPCWTVTECNIVKREQAINQCNAKGSSCFPFTRTIEGYEPGDPLPL